MTSKHCVWITVILLEKKLELHKSVYENKDFYNFIMPSKGSKILESNQYQKSDKSPFIICTCLQCLIEKTDGCKNNSEKSFTTKVGEYIQSGFSVPIIPSFKSIQNKNDVWRGKDCVKWFN